MIKIAVLEVQNTRIRFGLCPTCGIQTQTPDGQPLTNRQVLNSRCLLCNPLPKNMPTRPRPRLNEKYVIIRSGENDADSISTCTNSAAFFPEFYDEHPIPIARGNFSEEMARGKSYSSHPYQTSIPKHIDHHSMKRPFNNVSPEPNYHPMSNFTKNSPQVANVPKSIFGIPQNPHDKLNNNNGRYSGYQRRASEDTNPGDYKFRTTHTVSRPTDRLPRRRSSSRISQSRGATWDGNSH